MEAMLEQKLTKEQIRAIIAKRAAKEFQDGDIVTLGIGLPTEVANYIPADKNVIFQSENGILGLGKSQSGPDFDDRIYRMPDDTRAALVHHGKYGTEII